jgi:hypothetical protein
LSFQPLQTQKIKDEAFPVDFLIRHLGFQQHPYDLPALQALWGDTFQPTLNYVGTQLIALFLPNKPQKGSNDQTI